MAYPSDLTDGQWLLLEPVLRTPGKRGRWHGPDLRLVVDAMLYVAQTGCQWRYLPEQFRSWTRVWTQFRRLAKSFENTTRSGSAWLQLACVALVLRHLTKPRPVTRGLELAA